MASRLTALQGEANPQAAFIDEMAAISHINEDLAPDGVQVTVATPEQIVQMMREQGRDEAFAVDAAQQQGVTFQNPVNNQTMVVVNSEYAQHMGKTAIHEVFHSFDHHDGEVDQNGIVDRIKAAWNEETPETGTVKGERIRLMTEAFGLFDETGRQLAEGELTQQQGEDAIDAYLSRRHGGDQSKVRADKTIDGRPMSYQELVNAYGDEVFARISEDFGTGNPIKNIRPGMIFSAVRNRLSRLREYVLRATGGKTDVAQVDALEKAAANPMLQAIAREFWRTRKALKTATFKDSSKLTAAVTPKKLTRGKNAVANVNRYAGTGMFRTNADGKVLAENGEVFSAKPGERVAIIPQAERNKMAKRSVEAINATLDSLGEQDDGMFPSESKTGKPFWVGIPNEAQLAAILALPDSTVPRILKQRIERTVEAARNGDTLGVDYNKALTGRKYDTLAEMEYRLVAPFGFRITQAGNFLAMLFDIGKLNEKVDTRFKSKPKWFSEWADDTDPTGREGFYRTLREALERQRQGIKNNRDNTVGYDKILQLLNIDRLDADVGGSPTGLIRSFRVDRMNEIQTAEPKGFRIDYSRYKNPATFKPNPQEVKAQPSDADYMRAVGDGDMETAQRMVDQAAKNAGYNVGDWWHGSGADNTTFDPKMRGRVTGASSAKLGDFFINNEAYAWNYARMSELNLGHSKYADLKKRYDAIVARGLEEGDLGFDKAVNELIEINREAEKRSGKRNLIEVPVTDRNGNVIIENGQPLFARQRANPDALVRKFYLKLNNPLVVDRKGIGWGQGESFTSILKRAKKSGNDSVILRNTKDAALPSGVTLNHDVAITFSPNQIKSADPITRDDAGNVISLSERFNEASDDIRFMPSDADYMKAVEGGDTEAAQRMVEQAAKAAGLNTEQSVRSDLLAVKREAEKNIDSIDDSVQFDVERDEDLLEDWSDDDPELKDVFSVFTKKEMFPKNRDGGSEFPYGTIWVKSDGSYDVSMDEHRVTAKSMDAAVSMIKEYIEDEYVPVDASVSEIIAASDFKSVALDLIDPENWGVDGDLHVARTGSAYITIGDKRYSIRDHDPSPFREAEFGMINGWQEVNWKNFDEVEQAVSWIAAKLASERRATYDDAGNVIPLSERFSESSDDIRFQPRNFQPEAPTRQVGNATITTQPGLIQFHPAYHGTPHKVDRFRTANIGTGEGTQAYGWGLYFAESQEVAQIYADKLNPMADVSDWVNATADAWNSIEDKWVQKSRSSEEIQSISEDALEWDWTDLSSVDDTLSDYEAQTENGKGFVDYLRKNLSEALARKESSLYKVDLKVTDDELLHWDLPLNEQPEGVRAKLSKPIQQYVIDNPNWVNDQARKQAQEGSVTGRYVYSWLAGERSLELNDTGNVPQLGSEMLSDAGIKGIKYADGFSRGKDGEQTFNYVIFDENDIEILEENGKPVKPSEVQGGDDIRFQPKPRKGKILRKAESE